MDSDDDSDVNLEEVERLARLIGDIIDRFAVENGIPVSIVVESIVAYRPIESVATEYHPDEDPDHPCHGWRPEKDEIAEY